MDDELIPEAEEVIDFDDLFSEENVADYVRFRRSLVFVLKYLVRRQNGHTQTLRRLRDAHRDHVALVRRWNRVSNFVSALIGAVVGGAGGRLVAHLIGKVVSLAPVHSPTLLARALAQILEVIR